MDGNGGTGATGAAGGRLIDESVAAFTDRLAERTPAPGGGGACAVAIAMAAGLVAMAARFSARQLPDAEPLAAQADLLRAEALPLVAADGDAYGELLAAFRDRSEDRDALVAAASKGACEVPLRMTDVAARTAAIAVTVGTTGNPNLAGDARTAALLCAAAAEAAAGLVAVNVDAAGVDPSVLSTARTNATAAQAAADALAPPRS